MMSSRTADKKNLSRAIRSAKPLQNGETQDIRVVLAEVELLKRQVQRKEAELFLFRKEFKRDPETKVVDNDELERYRDALLNAESDLNSYLHGQVPGTDDSARLQKELEAATTRLRKSEEYRDLEQKQNGELKRKHDKTLHELLEAKNKLQENAHERDKRREIEDKYESLKEEHEALQSEMSTMKAKIAMIYGTKNATKELRDTIATLEKKLEEEKTENRCQSEIYKQKIEEFEEKLERLKREKESSDRDLRIEHDQNVRSLKWRVKELEVKVEAQAAQLLITEEQTPRDVLEKERDALNVKLEVIQEKVLKQEREHNETQAKLKKRNEDVTELENKIRDLERKLDQEQSKHLMGEITALRKRVETEASARSEAEEQLVLLKKSLEDSPLKGRIYQNDIEELQKQLEKEQKEKEDIRLKLCKAEHDVSELRRNAHEAFRKIHKLEMDVEGKDKHYKEILDRKEKTIMDLRKKVNTIFPT